MVRGLTVFWDERHLNANDPRPISESLRVAVPDGAAMLPHPLAVLELGKQHGGKKIGGQVTGAQVHPCVLVDQPTEEVAPVGPFLSNDLGPLDVLRIADNDGSALATRE